MLVKEVATEWIPDKMQPQIKYNYNTPSEVKLHYKK